MNKEAIIKRKTAEKYSGRKLRNIYRNAAVFCAALLAAVLAGTAALGAEIEPYTATDFAMDTVVSETL